MARSCNCSGSSCGCLVTAGPGIVVTGIGTAANPFRIEATADSFSDAFEVDSTTTVALTLLGSGTTEDPFMLSAQTNVFVKDIEDVVDATTPIAGEVLTAVGSGETLHWEYRATARPYTTANRPVPASLAPGTCIFNTSTNKPNWTDGTNWRDATGTVV